MKDTNHVVLVGRLTRDAVQKYLQSGLSVVDFSIAVNRSVKKGDKWEDEASFFDVTLFGKSGEAVAQYLTKGQQIAVAGELKQDRWEKDGQKHSRVVIVADTVQLVGGKHQDRHQERHPDSNASEQGEFKDDIPF